MNLLELKDAIDKAIHSVGMEGRNPKDTEVLINLHEVSFGPGASTKVHDAYLGFDWESNQFRFVPSEHLIRF